MDQALRVERTLFKIYVGEVLNESIAKVFRDAMSIWKPCRPDPRFEFFSRMHHVTMYQLNMHRFEACLRQPDFIIVRRMKSVWELEIREIRYPFRSREEYRHRLDDVFRVAFSAHFEVDSALRGETPVYALQYRNMVEYPVERGIGEDHIETGFFEGQKAGVFYLKAKVWGAVRLFFLRETDHVPGLVYANYAARRNANRDPGTQFAVAATQIQYAFVFLKRDSVDQRFSPSLLRRRIFFVVLCIPFGHDAFLSVSRKICVNG